MLGTVRQFLFIEASVNALEKLHFLIEASGAARWWLILHSSLALHSHDRRHSLH